MPKAYPVVTYRSVSDPQKLAAYAKLAVPAVTPFGARILARSNAAVALEHGLKERTVVVEYPSLERATAWLLWPSPFDRRSSPYERVAMESELIRI